MRDEVKDSSAFLQVISKFLATNTLQSVCYWLQDLVSLQVQGPAGEVQAGAGTQPFTYTPPLPVITTRPLSTFMQVNPDPDAVCKVIN